MCTAPYLSILRSLFCIYFTNGNCEKLFLCPLRNWGINEDRRTPCFVLFALTFLNNKESKIAIFKYWKFEMFRRKRMKFVSVSNSHTLISVHMNIWSNIGELTLRFKTMLSLFYHLGLCEDNLVILRSTCLAFCRLFINLCTCPFRKFRIKSWLFVALSPRGAQTLGNQSMLSTHQPNRR